MVKMIKLFYLAIRKINSQLRLLLLIILNFVTACHLGVFCCAAVVRKKSSRVGAVKSFKIRAVYLTLCPKEFDSQKLRKKKFSKKFCGRFCFSSAFFFLIDVRTVTLMTVKYLITLHCKYK